MNLLAVTPQRAADQVLPFTIKREDYHLSFGINYDFTWPTPTGCCWT